MRRFGFPVAIDQRGKSRERQPARHIGPQNTLALIAFSGDHQDHAVVGHLSHLQKIQKRKAGPVLGHAMQVDAGIDGVPALAEILDDPVFDWMGDDR